MKLCRFDADRFGLVSGPDIRDVTAVVEELVAGAGSAAPGDPVIGVLAGLSRQVPGMLRQSPVKDVASARLLSPVRAPGKIVAAPVNYHAHVAEMQSNGMAFGHNLADIAQAGLFLKASSSLVGPGEGVALRFPERRTDHEVELVAVVGKAGSDIPVASALDHVAGYCLGIDVTLRGSEDRSFRKSIDGYSVVGPWLVSADEIADPNDLRISLTVNGEPRQDAGTRDMVYSVERLIHYASTFFTLHPGDLLFTGTPQGVGPIRPGDLLRADCPAIGAMEVRVREHLPRGGRERG